MKIGGVVLGAYYLFGWRAGGVERDLVGQGALDSGSRNGACFALSAYSFENPVLAVIRRVNHGVAPSAIEAA